jgi:hypothetical protein
MRKQKLIFGHSKVDFFEHKHGLFQSIDDNFTKDYGGSGTGKSNTSSIVGNLAAFAALCTSFNGATRGLSAALASIPALIEVGTQLFKGDSAKLKDHERAVILITEELHLRDSQSFRAFKALVDEALCKVKNNEDLTETERDAINAAKILEQNLKKDGHLSKKDADGVLDEKTSEAIEEMYRNNYNLIKSFKKSYSGTEERSTKTAKKEDEKPGILH